MAYNTDLYKIIYTSTKGIIFFATPQGGGNNVSVGNIAASILRTITNNPNNAYLESLRHNSLCSQTNREDFIQRSSDFRFISVIESLPTKGITVYDPSLVFLLLWSQLISPRVIKGCP